MVALEKVCLEDRRGIDGASAEAAGLPYLSLENVESMSGKIVMGSDSKLRGISNCFRFGPEHILYGKLRPYLNKVALPNFHGRCTTELIPLLPKRNIHRKFLALLLRRPETVDWVMREKTGSRMPRANMKRLMQLEILLPPISEQNRIVEILENEMLAVERARSAAIEQVEAARALGAAFLREVFEFGGKGLPIGWKWVSLREIAGIIPGQSPTSDTYRKESVGLPFFQGKADFGQRHPTARIWCIAPKTIAQPDDILISVRAPVGPTNVANVECCIGRGLAAIRCGDDVERDFVLFFMKFYESAISQMGTGSTFGAISKNQLLNIQIPIPSFGEQRQIVAALNSKMVIAQKARAAAEAELEAIEALPGALLRRAFGGEL